MASVEQAQFLADLFADCGYNRHQRKGFLAKRFGDTRIFIFLDRDLTTREASLAIEELIEQREGRREKDRFVKEDDDE